MSLSLLFPLAPLNPEHLAAIIDNRRAMRHEYECLANLALCQALEHLLFGSLVKRRCHLVENEYAARAQY